MRKVYPRPRLPILGALCAITMLSTPLTAGEAPLILGVEANAPGIVTIAFSHSGGDGEIIQFYVEHVGGDRNEQRPPVQVGDGFVSIHGLEPKTDYVFKLCADDGTGEPDCAATGSITTMASELPVNMTAPIITGSAATPDTITVFWGATGDYPVIIARLTDANDRQVEQTDVKNIPHRLYAFRDLPEDRDYIVRLKGCNRNVGSSSCGAWSKPLRVHTRTSVACPRYAQAAMAAAERNRQWHCGYRGEEWSASEADHLSWCNGLADTDLDAIKSHTDARERAIEACGNKRSATCSPYADKAWDAALLNKNRNCKNTGDRWSTDRVHHFNWCMNLASADKHFMQSETKARSDAIKNCTGILYPQPPPDVPRKPGAFDPLPRDLEVQKKRWRPHKFRQQ